jgi:tetratricopeptide (TPR) repeat protein
MVPTPEQVKLLRERPWFGVTEKTLEIELKVYGPWHRQVETSAEQLGNIYRAQGKWEQEAKCRRVVIEARRALLGADHWRTVDARLELTEALAQQKRTPAQRAAVARARARYAQSLVLGRKGQPAKALGPAKEALAINKEVLGEKHPNYAVSLNNLAWLYVEIGDHKRALPLLKQALKILKEAQGEKHPNYAASMSNLAALYKDMGDYKAALPHTTKAVAIFKEVLGEKHPNYPAALNVQAVLYLEMGDYKAALPLFKQALKITKETLGEKHPSYATRLNNLAALYKEMGEYKQALPLHEQALEINKDVYGEKHFLYANSLNNLALLYKSMGNHKAALALYQKALQIAKEASSEKHPLYAKWLNNLASLYSSMGKPKAALLLHKQALAIYRETLGEKHPDYALNLNNLAVLYEGMGDHKAALPLLQQVLRIRKEALGEKHPAYAQSVIGLAWAYQKMGDHKQALLLHKQALSIQNEALGEKHPHYADSLNNLASLYKDMGDHKQALPLHKQALAIRKEVLGKKHPAYGKTLNDLAMLYRAMGDHAAALPLHEQALQIAKETLGEKHPNYAIVLNNIAVPFHNAGDYKQALLLRKQALAIQKEAFGKKHPEYAISLHNLAVQHLEMGDHITAQSLAEEAIAQTLAHLRDSASVQSDRQQFAAAESARPCLELRLSLGDAGCYGHVLAWKGAVLLRQRQRRLFTALSADPKTREAANELRDATRQIAALSATSRPIREQLQRLTRDQERLQAKLSELSTEAEAAFKGPPLTPRTLSAALPKGVALVDYHFYQRAGITYRDGRTNWVRHLVAFVSRKGQPTVRLDLGPAEPAADAAGQWRKSLLRRESGRAQGSRLKALVWSPLEKHLAGAKVVLISPDEALAGVPFAALPGKKPGTYLIEDVALAVVPVPAMLPEMLKPVDKAKRLSPSLLIVGSVDYDKAGTIARADAEDNRGAPLGLRRNWGKLSATFAETASVSKSFSKLFKKGTVIDLDGADATKAKVRQTLANVRYAHLATHGFFAPEDIKNALGGEKKADDLFGRGGVAGWHPLLLSGIVLAGANKEPKAGEEDGILTALEVSEMELPKLELVVLSACETGLGKTAGGEGLLGLQRAFQVAGARTTVASLWSVDDKTTQLLMAEFYRVAWDTESSVSRAEALRRAQLSILNEGKRGLGKKGEKLPKGETRLPPLYWAAFVLSGDWR